MTQAIGFLGKMGAVEESVYGTEAAVTQMLQLVSESLVDQPRLIRSNVLDGRPQTRQADQGTITIGGDIVTRFRYQNGNKLLRNWFGSYNSGTGIYTPIGTTEGLSMTVAVDKKVSVWTYKGVKCHQLVIAGTPDGIMMTASVYATDLDKESVVNTTAVLRTLIDPSNNAMFHHVRIRMRDHNGSLDSGDEIKVTTFTLTLQRPLDQIFVNAQQGVTEPFESNFRNITLAFVIPRYNSDSWHAWKDAKTRLQADFLFTDPISGRTRLFEFPNVELDVVGSPVAGPASVPINVTAMASESEDSLVSTMVSFDSADNSINITSATAAKATGTLTLTGSVGDGETVTIDRDVYESDTEPGSVGGVQVTSGHIAVDVAGGTTRQAKGTLTLPTQPTNGDTFTIAGRVYTMDTNGALVNTNGHIEIGSSLANTKTNIYNAINLLGTPGTGYASTMVKHPSVSSVAFSGNDMVITANKGGTAGNSLATTETFTAVNNVFDAATLGTTQAGVNATAAEFITALIAAVSAGGVSEVDVAQGAGTTLTATARTPGTGGNSLATTETLTNGSWGAATLTGGTGTVDELPYSWAGADIYIAGAATAGNNGIATVVSRTAHKIVIDPTDITLVSGVVGPSITLVSRTFDVLLTET